MPVSDASKAFQLVLFARPPARGAPCLPPGATQAEGNGARSVPRKPAEGIEMSHFVLMLTKDDRTVPNALAAYDEVRDMPLAYVGFKDIGLPFDEMKALAARIRADDRRTMLEVVSTSREEELRSIRAAIEIGVDYLLGGRHVSDALPLLAGTAIRYFPFCGDTIGHPTRLEGTIDETVADACRLALMPGVHGLDLLSYRFAGDAATGAADPIACSDAGSS